MKDAFHLAAATPWMIQAEALETILAVAQRCGDPEALQTRTGRKLDNARNVSMRDNVAVIPVSGPIFRYANLFTEISGATSTQVLAKDIQAALDNPFVKAIVLDINSPGGEATGINELAAMIHSARGTKPVTAYVGGVAASAAYWIASAADSIVMDAIGIVGSIGVVMSHLDTTKRDKKSGVQRVEIVSSASPDKRIDPTTDEGKAKVQAIVDAMADIFVNTVARNRGVPATKVLSDFGRGGVLVGQAAVKAGMADRIGSLEAVIAELAGSASNPTRKTPMSENTKGQVTVSTTADLRNALAAGHTAEQITIAPPAATASTEAIAAARAEGEAAGRAAAAETAVAGERKRIADVQALAAKGFEKELQAAIANGDAPGAFALTLMAAAKDRGITLEAISKDAPKAAAHAGHGNDDSATAAPKISATSIFASRRKATGR